MEKTHLLNDWSKMRWYGILMLGRTDKADAVIVMPDFFGMRGAGLKIQMFYGMINTSQFLDGS